MSVNYYLDSADNDAGHLGKWTNDHFIAYAPEGVDSFQKWAAQMDGRKIFAESGYEVTQADIVAMASRRNSRGHAAAPSPNHHRREFMAEGVLFVTNRFC